MRWPERLLAWLTPLTALLVVLFVLVNIGLAQQRTPAKSLPPLSVPEPAPGGGEATTHVGTPIAANPGPLRRVSFRAFVRLKAARTTDPKQKETLRKALADKDVLDAVFEGVDGEYSSQMAANPNATAMPDFLQWLLANWQTIFALIEKLLVLFADTPQASIGPAMLTHPTYLANIMPDGQWLEDDTGKTEFYPAGKTPTHTEPPAYTGGVKCECGDNCQCTAEDTCGCVATAATKKTPATPVSQVVVETPYTAVAVRPGNVLVATGPYAVGARRERKHRLRNLLHRRD
jgi:hypothetical protein